jgi:hypothetical protein
MRPCGAQQGKETLARFLGQACGVRYAEALDAARTPVDILYSSLSSRNMVVFRLSPATSPWQRVVGTFSRSNAQRSMASEKVSIVQLRYPKKN